jgi:hypothetical protein
MREINFFSFLSVENSFEVLVAYGNVPYSALVQRKFAKRSNKGANRNRGNVIRGPKGTSATTRRRAPSQGELYLPVKVSAKTEYFQYHTRENAKRN